MLFRRVGMGKNWVVADLAKRRVNEVRVRANYSIGTRRRGQYCHVLCLSQVARFYMLSVVQ